MKTAFAVLACALSVAAQDAVLHEASSADTQQGAPHGIGIIDVNQDGRPDVVIAQIRPAGVNIFLNDGKGNVKGDYNKMLGTRMGPNFGMAARADADAFLDFIQLDNNSGKLTVYKGSKGKLSDGQETDLGVGWPISAFPCDLNGDRQTDFVIAGWPDPVVDKTPGRLKVLLGPTLKESISLDIPECGAAAAGDVNGDKKPDVLTTDQKEGVLMVFAGDGRGQLSRTPARIPLDPADKGLKPKGILVADLTGDKILDIALCCEERQFVRILKGDGKGGFTTHLDIALATKAKFVFTGDFNGDKHADLAIGACIVAAGAQWSVTIHLGDGQGAYAKNCEFNGKGNFHFYSAAVGDMDGDKKDDLAVAVINEDEGSGSVRRYLSRK
ncbi:MAG: VCBS repeat-containing protein [Candidatus Brocadiae bacterium]|nr:VCBS repeat-containing protein [Candidatus Brocadiia bacterium]